MRRILFLLGAITLASLTGCSVYQALFGMFGENYASTSPDRASRFIEMQSEVDRWEARDRMMAIEDR